jgi:hypothetical protein
LDELPEFGGERGTHVTSEGTAFEYAMGLFSVLIGLAVVDVATSFHRLARVRRSISWDPLTLIVALYTLSMAVYMWFDLLGRSPLRGRAPFSALYGPGGGILRSLPNRGR